MAAVTDADREAAEELRVQLANLSGFWFRSGDDGPLCAALAAHRERCEAQLLETMRQSSLPRTAGRASPCNIERVPSLPLVAAAS
jgi:hypothetical protein